MQDSRSDPKNCARLDLRSILHEIFDAVLDFAIRIECVLLTDDIDPQRKYWTHAA